MGHGPFLRAPCAFAPRRSRPRLVPGARDMTRLRAWRPADRAARPAGMLVVRHPGEQAGTRFRPPGTHHRGAASATVAKNTGRCHRPAHSLGFRVLAAWRVTSADAAGGLTRGAETKTDISHFGTDRTGPWRPRVPWPRRRSAPPSSRMPAGTPREDETDFSHFGAIRTRSYGVDASAMQLCASVNNPSA